MAGVFVLSERQLKELPAGEARKAVSARIEAEGLAWLPWQEQSEAFLERLRYAARLGRLPGLHPGLWQEPRFAERLLIALAPYLAAAGPIVDGAGLTACLEDMARDELGPRAVAILENEAPAFIVTPGGRKRRPRYPAQGEASLALRIQEAFGLRASPAVCGGPLVLELLSPADRPLQLTKDIASFWRTAYPSLRPELSRRYPKHYWPEDPLSAEPTRGLKPRP
jgi:ATP-dependent helicase HrpB